MGKFLFVLLLSMLVIFPATAQEATEEVGSDTSVTVVFDEINVLANSRGYVFAGYVGEEGFTACLVQWGVSSVNVNTCVGDWLILDEMSEPHSYVISEESYWSIMGTLETLDEIPTSTIRPYFDRNSDCSDSWNNRGCVYTSLTIPSQAEPYCVGKVTQNLSSVHLPDYEQYYVLETALTAIFRFEVNPNGIPMLMEGDFVEFIPINETNDAIGVSFFTPEAIDVNTLYPVVGEQFVVDMNLIDLIHCPPNFHSVSIIE